VVTEQLFPGQSVPVTFFRAGRRHQVTLKLAQRPASPG
jgi:S1-C subfamily serine protease